MGDFLDELQKLNTKFNDVFLKFLNSIWKKLLSDD